eukprot:symbB.v1.2.017298.t1/scaffold1343.1/size124258/7
MKMPAGKPKEWRWVANHEADLTDSEHSTDWRQGSGWDSQHGWWMDDGRNGWQDDSGHTGWQGQSQTTSAWDHSDWQSSSKDVSMQWANGCGSATDATTVQQEWLWPVHDSQQWNQQTWTETPTPAAWVEATVPPPPGNWNPNKISMEEAIEWAAEETAKHEKALQDGEEMAEKEIRLNAAKAKAKPSSGQMALKPFCLDLVKGWTRATAVTFIALVASELDLDDPATMPLLEPLGKEARDVMSNHLQFCKWRDSAFSAEQFKSTRWLLNARPKQVPESLKDVLTVTPMAQVMLLELHVHSFLQASRRLKVSQRARVRASADDFEKLADFACVFASIRQKAKAASSDPAVDGKLLDAFMAKDYWADVEACITSKNPSFRLTSLTVWEDIVEPPSVPMALQMEDSSADALAAQEQALASRFHEIKIKLANDCAAMVAFKQTKGKHASKLHVMKVDKSTINIFCSSKLWQGQLVTGQPKAIQESQFVVPGAVSSAEGRRNYTDVQETAQWLGGVDRPAIVVNGSLYDGMLEKACLKLGIPTISQTDKPAAFSTALALSKTHLIELWKAREGPMADRLPRYKGDLDDVNVPTAPEAPQLSLCTIVDNVLVLPRDVRTEFLTDPIRSAEWRKLLGEFDRTFAAGEQGSGEVSSAATAPVEAEDAAFKWSDLFPEECKDAIAFHAKYQNNIKGKCAWCPELQVYIVDTSQENIEEHDKKPMLFIEAKETYEIATNEPFLTYGAGTWLMGSKADQWLKDQEGHKHKACLCAFKSDQALVDNDSVRRSLSFGQADFPPEDSQIPEEQSQGFESDTTLELGFHLKENENPEKEKGEETEKDDVPPETYPVNDAPPETYPEPSDDVPPETYPEPSNTVPESKPKKRKAEMLEEEKQMEIERKKQVHRENSARWHQKWIAKGVPRVIQPGAELGPPSVGEAAGDAGAEAGIAGDAEAAGHDDGEAAGHVDGEAAGHAGDAEAAGHAGDAEAAVDVGDGAGMHGEKQHPDRLNLHPDGSNVTLFLGDTRSAEELAVFTNMAPERLCLGCGLRVEEKFTPIFPGERGPLFAASVKLLQFALRASSASASEKVLTEEEDALLKAIRPLVANPDCHFLAVLTVLVQSILEGRTDCPISGVFGAGKTRAAAAVIAGLVVMDPTLKIMVVTKENAAAHAFAKHIESLQLPPSLEEKFGRLVGATELEKGPASQTKLDVLPGFRNTVLRHQAGDHRLWRWVPPGMYAAVQSSTAGKQKWSLILPSSARVSELTYVTIIGTRYPELDNSQNDIIQFGNYLQAEQCTRGGFLPIFWDAPYSYINASTDIGEVVDWITDKFVVANKGDLAVLHNRNKMVNAFSNTEWVSGSGGAIISRSVTSCAGMTAYLVLLAQTRVGFLSGGRGKSFHQLPTQEQAAQREEAHARATVALTRAQQICFIMGPLDMRGLVGAATIIGGLKYGACFSGLDDQDDPVFLIRLKDEDLVEAPHDSAHSQIELQNRSDALEKMKKRVATRSRDDYYEDYHYGGSREDRQGWDDYYEDRHQDYYEEHRWDYHQEDDRSGWRDWGDQDDQDDEWYGRARCLSRRRLPRQSALANPVSGFGKKQLSAGEELSALVPVSDRSSFEFEGLVEECPTLVRVVNGQGSTSRGFVWGALCFAAAVLSSTRVVVLRGLRCLWCLSAAVRNRLAHSLNGNQEGLYPWIVCGIISLATYRVGEEFADGATAVVRVTTEMIEDVFETTSIEVQETIQWVGMFARATLVVVVWYVGRTCWSKLMHVLHGNTTTKGPTDVEARRFLLNEPASTRLIGLCSRVAVEGAERIYQVEGSSGASYRSVLHDTDKSKIRCSCKAYVFSGKPCKHLVEVARRESVHGTEKDILAPELPLAIARGRAASSAQALAGEAQANRCLDGNFADTPLQGIKKTKEGPKELVRARPAESELAVKFVPNFTSQQILVDSLKAWPKCDITLVAYSFDQPQVVEALEGHQGRTRLLADLSQTNGKTKQQYQVLFFRGRAEDEALLQVTQVDTMAGSQVTPKTWTSPRDLAYVPPPQTGKLSRFLNISIYSAAPDIAVKRREGPGKLHLLSHRSCSQDQSAECNQGFIKEMEGVSKEADTWPEINERHLYTSLPDELMNDPRWQNHVKPGVRGRGYWFWKAALSRMLLSQGVFQLGDELLYVDGDSKTMIKHIIRT